MSNPFSFYSEFFSCFTYIKKYIIFKLGTSELTVCNCLSILSPGFISVMLVLFNWFFHKLTCVQINSLVLTNLSRICLGEILLVSR